MRLNQTIKKPTRLIKPKNGNNGKGLFSRLKQKTQKETHLVPFQSKEESISIPTRAATEEHLDNNNGNQSVKDNLESIVTVVVEAIRTELKSIVDMMKEKNWKESDVKTRMNVFSQLTQNFTQLFNADRVNKGKDIGRIKHTHSWEGMSIKELEDKEEEMNALLGRKTVTKRITIEQTNEFNPSL